MNQKDICNKINDAIKSLTEVKEILFQKEFQWDNQNVIATSVNTEFDNLKTALFSDKWPAAVNENLICDPNSENDKIERGFGIIELVIDESLNNDQKFLDYGCGEGHCVTAAADSLGCGLSVGYDIKQHNWPTVEKTFFSSNFQQIIDRGPYDVIMLFDVLDHVVNETPVEILTKLSNILNENGKMYIRCHPWISRHGSHLYHKLNKAYIQLAFTEEELKLLINDYVPEPNLRVTKPIATYFNIFESANLQIVSDRQIKENVDSFFRIPKIEQRIINNSGHEIFPEFQMSISFIDYVLKKRYSGSDPTLRLQDAQQHTSKNA